MGVTASWSARATTYAPSAISEGRSLIRHLGMRWVGVGRPGFKSQIFFFENNCDYDINQSKTELLLMLTLQAVLHSLGEMFLFKNYKYMCNV